MIDKDAKTTAVYMTIKNRSGRTDHLLRASPPIAAKVELRVPGAGATGTEPKGAGALSIGVGKSLELTRTGPYLLLTGMKKQLHATTASR